MSKRAIVFAGQGAQFTGMGRDLAETYPACADLFKRADDILGYGLSQICFNGPDEELTKTQHCQPGIFVMSAACYTALQERGAAECDAMAGLSLGEWTALYAGGAIDFDSAVRVLEARGRFMQEACDERAGAMCSVMGLSVEQLEALARESGVTLANINSEQQIVLSGERDAVEEAERLAQAAGARRTVMLNVAGAYHSPLMNSAAEKLAAVLADIEIRPAKLPVLSNVTGQPHGSPEAIKSNMLKQITGSVRWLDCITTLKDSGVTSYLELGPGKVLSGLIKRIDRGADLRNVQDLASLEAAVTA